jgi:hypothetical protein
MRYAPLKVKQAFPFALAILWFAAAPARAESVDLTGLWEDMAGNVHTVTHRNGKVIAVLKTVSDAAKSYGFAVGDESLRLTLGDKGMLSGQMHLHYEPTLKDKCQDKWDFWDTLQLTLGNNSSDAVGFWHNTRLDEGCVVHEGLPPYQPWYMFRPLVLENVKHEGFIDDPVPPLVADPVLPRFFFNEKGHASVDLDAKVLTAGMIQVQLMRDGTVEQSLNVNVRSMKPNALSNGRWFTLDLHALFEGKYDSASGTPGGPTYVRRSLYEERKPFTIRLLTNGAPVAESPVIDKWRLLEFMHERAVWLARTLFHMTLAAARELDAEKREGQAWRIFTNYRRPAVTLSVRNRGRTAQFVDEPIRVYALMDGADWPNGSELLDEKRIELSPGASADLSFAVNIAEWNDARFSAFRGLYLMEGSDAGRIASRPDDGSTARFSFKLDPLEPWRVAAARINKIVDEPRTTERIVLAARAYLAKDPPVADINPFGAAVEWSELIKEFEGLETLKNDLFATDDLAKLNEEMQESAKDRSVHVGLPHSEATETIGNAKPSPQQYVLSLPGYEQFKAGLMAFATGGLTGGEVPLPDSLRTETDATAVRQPRWRASNDYVDRFLDVPAGDLRYVADALQADNPRATDVQGEVAEALAARYVGRQIESELRQTNPKALFIPGNRIRDYRFQSEPEKLGGRGLGTKVTDGVVLSPEGRTIDFVNLEVKSGTAGVENAPNQLGGHEGRELRRGLTILEPTQQEIDTLRPYGAQVVPHSISGRPPIRVLHLQQGALKPSSEVAQRRVLVLPDGIPEPEGAGQTVTVRRLPASWDELRVLTNRLIELRGLPGRRPVPKTAQPPEPSTGAAAVAALGLLGEWAGAGATEADRVGRLRLRVTMCNYADAKQLWVGVQRGTLGRGDQIEWETTFRDPSVQKVLLSAWYQSSRSIWQDGDVPPWLANAIPDGTGDRCK